MSTSLTTRPVRVVGAIAYMAANGELATIPVGPALIQPVNAQLAEIVWGAEGENSATLPITRLEAAALEGALVAVD